MISARAAQLWHQLERRLIACGLPQGASLDRERPALIRAIGDAMSGAPHEAQVPRPIAPDVSRPRLRKRSTVITREQAAAIQAADAKLAAMLEKACSRRTGYDGDDSVSY
jgi:hypothetical protein